MKKVFGEETYRKFGSLGTFVEWWCSMDVPFLEGEMGKEDLEEGWF